MLKIKLKDEASMISVNCKLVQLVSNVAAELPDGANVWDLSGLLVEGDPVNRGTLLDWLNIVYRLIYAKDYESTGKQHMTVSELVRLLTFADAVGSTEGVMQAVVAGIKAPGSLKFAVLVVGTKVVGTPIVFDYSDAGYLWEDNPVQELYIRSMDQGVKPAYEVQFTHLGVKWRQEILPQMSSQIEQLLYWSMKLGLTSLHNSVLSLIRNSTVVQQGYAAFFTVPMLSSDVYTPRVLDAMCHAPEAIKQAWISHSVMH